MSSPILFILAFLIFGYCVYQMAKLHQLDSELIYDHMFSSKNKMEKIEYESKKIIKKFRLYLFFYLLCL